MKNLVLSWMEKLGIPTKGLGFDYIKNTSWVTVAKFFEQIFSYLIIVLISRYLGAEGLGQYSFIFAFVGLFFIFSDWGMNYMMLKDLSRDFSNVNKYVSNILTFKIILLFSSLCLYIGIIFFIGKNNIILDLIVAGIITLIQNLGIVWTNLAKVKNDGVSISWTIFIERLLALIIGGYFLIIYESLTFFIFALLISQSIKTIMLYHLTKKNYKYTYSLNFKFIFNLIKKGYPFLLITAFAMIYVRLDSIILSFMQGDLVTGWYNAPYKLINVLNVVPSILLMFGFPMFSKLFKENKNTLKILLEKINYYSLVLIFPMIVGVLFLSERILKLIYGFGGIESALAFQILIFVQLFVFLTTILGQFIAAVDKQKIFAKIAGFGALLNIGLNFILIPKYSLYGAAIATLITYILMFLFMYFYVNSKILQFRMFKNLFVPLISSIIMGSILINIIHFHVVYIVLICAFSYILLVGSFEIYNLKKEKIQYG